MLNFNYEDCTELFCWHYMAFIHRVSGIQEQVYVLKGCHRGGHEHAEMGAASGSELEALGSSVTVPWCLSRVLPLSD